MPYELCRHVMSSGRRCKSPAVRNEDWCFFHNRIHRRYDLIRQHKHVANTTPLLIPSLEDAESIQVGITLVVEALACGRIEEKRGALLLRGLQCAARNVRNLRLLPPPEDVVCDFGFNLAGLDVAGREMSDNSEPPPRSPRPSLKQNPVAPADPDAVS